MVHHNSPSSVENNFVQGYSYHCPCDIYDHFVKDTILAWQILFSIYLLSYLVIYLLICKEPGTIKSVSKINFDSLAKGQVDEEIHQSSLFVTGQNNELPFLCQKYISLR